MGANTCVIRGILCRMTTEALGTAPANTGSPWIPDDATFGARLALIRQRMGWGNLKEAALACGLPVQSWRAWERDNVSPRNYPFICQTIAEVTGCDFDWLMRGAPGHKFGYVPAATRPVDNRPAGRPRTGDAHGNARRARRLRTGPAGTPSRRAA
jgi:hypothetical protein